MQEYCCFLPADHAGDTILLGCAQVQCSHSLPDHNDGDSTGDGAGRMAEDSEHARGGKVCSKDVGGVTSQL